MNFSNWTIHKRKNSAPVAACPLLLLLLLFHTSIPASVPTRNETTTDTYLPQTFRVLGEATVHDAPEGNIIAAWDPDTRFTSREQLGDWIRVSGIFPGDQWTPAPDSLWINRQHAESYIPEPGPIPSGRPGHISRYITVDKSDYRLRVFEHVTGSVEEREIYSARVALGMDRCLPQEQGGHCYFTDPGEYQIRWKIHDPLGIEWCIPESMEQEFREDIEAGNRCFRGTIGNYALNIGKTYAIHGTASPVSIGTSSSHGCIRTVNSDMEHIFNMMDVGDRVYIVE